MITIGTARASGPERTFRALPSEDVLRWWIRPGVFDTREWTGDVRPGGRWHASGVGGGKPYALDGGFIEVDPSRRLVHTWSLGGGTSRVAYDLEPVDGGTRITLRHTDLASRQACAATCIGWETSFEELARMLNS